MSNVVQELVEILNLRPTGVDLFEGQSPQVGWQRVFGGLVVAQALVAAQRTVPDKPVHSLHSYFVLPGDPAVPIEYAVERIRDGRSFATRRCCARQNGRIIFSLEASFHADEEGFNHQSKMPDGPAPGELALFSNPALNMSLRLPAAVRAYFERERPIELRPVSFKRYGASDAPSAREPAQDIWMRCSSGLPDDPHVHRAVLAYMSDMTLLDTSLAAHGTSVFEPTIQGASLDHSIWFHRRFRADTWLLYSQVSPSASGALGFTRGEIFSENGDLIATVAQEGLIRPRRDL